MALKEASNLEEAHLNMTMRRKTKIYNPEEFLANEGVCMSQLQVELLRYGLDSPSDLKKFNSSIRPSGKGGLHSSYEDLSHLLVEEGKIPENDGFDEKRNKSSTFAGVNKRPAVKDNESTESTTPSLEIKRWKSMNP